MKMLRRICSILFRNDSIVPFQMQQLVLRAVIRRLLCSVSCSSGGDVHICWGLFHTHNLSLAHTNNATNNDSVSVLVALWCANGMNGGVSKVPNVPILNLLLF